MTSQYRIYVHAASPAFLPQLKREVAGIMVAASPHAARKAGPTVKPLKIYNSESDSGVEFRGTLRDIWILCHKLRCADDISVQLVRRGNFVHSITKLNRVITKAPLHLFAHRIDKPKGTGKKDDAERLRREMRAEAEGRNVGSAGGGKYPEPTAEELRQFASQMLLHNNIRVVSKGSVLCNDKLIKTKVCIVLAVWSFICWNVDCFYACSPTIIAFPSLLPSNITHLVLY